MKGDHVTPASPTPLARRLGLLGVLFLTLSVTTPASSVFVILPGMLQVAGTGALWSMLIAGVVCVATALIYAELSSAWPVAGGEYVAVAHTLGPAAGFVMLGVNLVNNLLFVPVVALGVSAVLGAVLPGLPAVPVAIAVVLLSALVAVLDIRLNALVTGVFLALEVLALVAVAALGYAEPVRGLGSLLLDPVAIGEAGLVPVTAAGVGLATTIAIFALNGYGSAVYFGEEMHEAPNRIARAILLALVLTLLLEAVPLVAALVGAPDLLALLASDDPFGSLVAARGGSALADWVAVGVVIAIVNSVIAWIVACARFLYSSARDRCWGRPVDAWLAAVHPRFGSPWLGTLIVGAAGVACCFLPLRFLLILSGTGLLAIYAGIALATIAGRRSGRSAHAPYRMPLYPLAPALTLLAIGYVAWESWWDLDEGRPALLATAAQIVAAYAYYRLVLRRRGEWTVRSPA
jgi:amino acid transporter